MFTSSKWRSSALAIIVGVMVVLTIAAIANPYWSLLLFYNIFLTYVVQTRHELPDRVAVHFGPDLYAAGWVSRKAFLILSPACTAAICLVLVTSAYAMSQAGIDFMARHVVWFTCAILALLFAAHALTIAANRRDPAKLPRSFWGILIAFQFGVFVWVILIVTHDRWGWPQ